MELIVEGSSFLWHQIRCLVAILLLVGQRKEAPSIVDDLLNIDKYPCKPQYTMCSELPLVLFDCEYADVEWRHEPHELAKVVKHWQDVWLAHHTKSVIVKRMIDTLCLGQHASLLAREHDDQLKKGHSNHRALDQPYHSLQGKSQSLDYVRFVDREKANSLETRVDHYVKRRRLDADVYGKLAENQQLAQSLNLYNNTTPTSAAAETQQAQPNGSS